MIEFKPIKVENKAEFEKYLFDGTERGCEYTFANMYMWGRQRAAIVEGHLVLFSQFDRKSVYPFPIGKGDKRRVLDAVMNDAKERGVTCRFTGLREHEMDILNELYPDRFHFHCDRASYDYVYDINDLADLKGRKYHSKKNHYNRFCAMYPNHRIEEINDSNIEKVMEMTERWYRERLEAVPESDLEMEQTAIAKAFRRYKELGMDGLVIFDGDDAVAMTMGSPNSDNTIDVHFEKAIAGVDGAYSAINREFAKYIREKYPNIQYLNREEDMGIEGLRKAKESYKPHHLVQKCWARCLEEGYEY